MNGTLIWPSFDTNLTPTSLQRVPLLNEAKERVPDDRPTPRGVCVASRQGWALA
jgi:hypothetical protein